MRKENWRSSKEKTQTSHERKQRLQNLGSERLILLDTHVLVWMESGNERLGANARRAIDRAWAEGEAAVSAVSFWEVAMLESKGRLELKLDLHSWRRDLLQRGLVEVAVDGGTALRAGQLVGIHGDPADRLIIATALAGYQLVTADMHILNWSGALDRLRATE